MQRNDLSALGFLWSQVLLCRFSLPQGLKQANPCGHRHIKAFHTPYHRDNGQKVAMRRFLPNEYLPKKSKIEKGMPSETPIQVEIELMDPGSKAVNFEFEFFKAS